MRYPIDEAPERDRDLPSSLFGGLLIPFVGLGWLYGTMALIDAVVA